MKILLMNSVCGIGSTGHIVEDLYYAYKNRGHDVRVIVGRLPVMGITNGDAICIQSKIELFHHVFMARIFDRHGLESNHATTRLIKFIKNFSPDVIHIHNLHGYYVNYKKLFEYLNTTNIKIVWTLHDCWTFTGHCAYYVTSKCTKWQTQCEKCLYKKNYPKSLLADTSKKQYLLKKNLFCKNNNIILVSPSQWLNDEVNKSFLKNKKSVVINNCIDIDIFKKTTPNLIDKYNIDYNKKIILGVSFSWSDGKGLNYFYKLSSRLSDDYQIVMVGVTKKLSKQLPKNIIAIEKTKSKEELAELYSVATVFLNPTLSDNYPTVNIEALCCGTPIICFSETGGGPEIVGNNGIILQDRSVESVEKAIVDIESIKVDYENVRIKYKKERYLNEYIQLIENM